MTTEERKGMGGTPLTTDAAGYRIAYNQLVYHERQQLYDLMWRFANRSGIATEICVGKGGDMGDTWMMTKGITLAHAQASKAGLPPLALGNIMMVGDRFDTDILGAMRIGIRSCLLEECGIHNYERHSVRFPGVECNWRAPCLAEMAHAYHVSGMNDFGIELNPRALCEIAHCVQILMSSRSPAIFRRSSASAARCSDGSGSF